MKSKFKPIKETKIRSSKFKNKLVKAYKKDINFLLKNKKFFVKFNCPACGNQSKKLEFIKAGLKYCRCIKCKTLYVNPRPSTELLKKFYSNSKGYEEWSKTVFPNSEKYRKKTIVADRIQIIKKNLNKKNKHRLALEIGPGFGTFAKALKDSKLFKNVTVIELNKPLIKECKRKKLEVIDKPIEEVEFKRKFDLISSFEVIEHLYSPKNFLKSVYKNLKKGGLLMLSCPNINGFDNLILKKNSSTIEHEHLNYFNPHSIKKLLKLSSFKILEVSTPGKLDFEIVKNFLSKNKNLIEKNSFLETLLFSQYNNKISENFQKFLYENCLSGHMLVLAKK